MPLDHYISRVYLKNFYSPALGSRMYAMRKGDLKWFTPDSKSVCRIEDGSTNAYLREDRFIEEFLRTIEPKYNSALAKLTDEKIDRDCIYTIAGFVAYVITCSPAGIRIFSGTVKAQAEHLAMSAEKQGRLPPLPESLVGTSIAQLLESGDIEITVNPKYTQAIGISSILRNVAAFGNFKWEILVNPFSQSPFFTSDYPVAIEQAQDPRLLNRIAPLSPNLAVRIRPDITIDRKRADFDFTTFGYCVRCISHEELIKINRLIVRSGEETIFFRDDLPWVRNFIYKNRDYRIEPIIQRIPTNGGSYLISTQRIVAHKRGQ
jgi:hypothetical protein